MSQSQLRNVIRPAILQPPRALTCPENPVVFLVTKKEARVQVKRKVILLANVCLQLKLKKKKQRCFKAVNYSTAWFSRKFPYQFQWN